MYQQITIIGFLGKDPDTRYTPEGETVANFPVATSKKFKGTDGQMLERTIWWKVSVFGKQAEACNTYLHKGSKAMVVGEMHADEHGQPRLWKGSDGFMHASFELTASKVLFLSSKDETSETPAPDTTDAPAGSNDDDTPF